MFLLWLLLLALLLYGLIYALRSGRLRKVVRDYEIGLLYRNGHLVRQLGTGNYWLNPLTTDITVIDSRRESVVVAGQEVMTADEVGLKVSAVVSYAVADAEKAMRSVKNYRDELYLLVQLALREALSTQTADSLLENRQCLGE